MGRERQGDVRAAPRRADAGDAGAECEGLSCPRRRASGIHCQLMARERAVTERSVITGSSAFAHDDNEQMRGDTMTDIRRIGIIGLGKMGMPMARLLREQRIHRHRLRRGAARAQGRSRHRRPAGQFAEGGGGGERSRHHRGRLRFRSRGGDVRRQRRAGRRCRRHAWSPSPRRSRPPPCASSPSAAPVGPR